MIVNPGPVLHALRTMPTCSLGSDAPSYICTGRSLRAQPAQMNPTTVRDTRQCSHADTLAFRMGLPFRSLDEETVCVSIAVSRRGVDEEYSFFTVKSSQPIWGRAEGCAEVLSADSSMRDGREWREMRDLLIADS
jgi:hypothetical protein